MAEPFLEVRFPELPDRPDVTIWQPASILKSTGEFRDVIKHSLHRYRRYNISTQIKRLDQLNAVRDFFLAVGPEGRFRYKDPFDFQSDGWQPAASLAASPDTVFQLQKRYVAGVKTYFRPITKPVAGTVTLRDGSGPVVGFTLDPVNGRVTLPSPPSGTLEAQFQFDVPVSFEDIDFNLSMTALRHGQARDVWLTEIVLRNADLGL